MQNDGDRLALGAVHLRITDLERSLGFWRDLVGLEELPGGDSETRLGVRGRTLVVLTPGAGAPQPRGYSGLYHLAIHPPDVSEFARVLARLDAGRHPQAPTDHIMSKSTYASDPDGIGLEVTLETPERVGSWRSVGGRLEVRDSQGNRRQMAEPLDVAEVLSHLGQGDLSAPLPPGTKIGHVHLHVSNLDAAVRFYRDVIGFEEHSVAPGIGMADFGAGGRFPHRLAVNVWQGAGAPQAPPDTAGMDFFTIVPASRETLDDIGERLAGLNLEHRQTATGLSTRDPAGNRMILAAP